jgi:plasmid stabilization system protein ParE
LRELREAAEFIAEYPLGAPSFHDAARAKTMSHFPYSIVYVVEPRRVLIVAVADERRDPSAYDHRLR